MNAPVTESTQLGVGFIGAGPVVQAIHLPTLSRLPDEFATAHVMDVDVDLAARVAQPFGARSSSRLEEVLEDGEVDVVAICSPSHLHAEQTIASCRAGKRAVLIEKPFATSAEEAETVAAVARETGTVLVVGAMHLYDPGWIASAKPRAALRSTTHTIRSSIAIPPNPRTESFATEIPDRAPFGANDPVYPADAIRDLLLGLAIHDLPLIRQQLPRAGSSGSLDEMQLLSVHQLDPWGYLVRLLVDDVLVELHAQTSIAGSAEWTLTLVGEETVISTGFGPSYVHAGSAISTVSHSGGATVTGRQEPNGYVGEWEVLHAAVTGRGRAPDPADHVSDIRFTTAIADIVSAHLSTTMPEEKSA